MAKFVERKSCPKCDRTVAFKTNGDPYKHLCKGELSVKCSVCEISFIPCANGDVSQHDCEPVSDPAPTVEAMDDEPSTVLLDGKAPDSADDKWPKGPWFGAMYDGECSVSECRIYEGDRIRADGRGGYECEDCGEAPGRLIAVTMTRSEALATLAAEGPDADMASLAFEREQEEAVRVLSAHPYVVIPDPPVRNVVELRLPAAPGPMPTPDEFTDPSNLTREDPGPNPPDPDEFTDPSGAESADELNVSGQPRARYEWRGSVNMGYLTTDPETGEFRRYGNGKPKGWTRATTFNKAASDSKAINDWGKRNIVIGASRRRDVLLRAHGLTHENDRAALEGIVAELEEAAGAKVGSDLGTYLHSFTELMDAGLKEPSDAPEEFRLSLARYEKALADAGLEPVPGLIERTTGIREFGGVRGTFDRIFYHRPSGTYMVGDLKTGKTMEYAMDETNTQMWIYAHGVNQNGVYDWNTDTWTRDEFIDAVSEETGVIVHMPVQGPQAGTVTLVHADLQAGARHAELCHAIRSRAKSKVKPFMPPEPAQVPVELKNETTEDIWRALFRGATTSEDATTLWKRAKEEGVQGIFLNELIELAKEAIRQHS